MEKLIIIVVAVLLAAIVALFILGYRSQSGAAPGLVDGRLAQCPGTPNCVCSEYASDSGHVVEPLVYSSAHASQVMPRLKTVIRDMGGIIQREQPDYLAASFTSSLFRFVDDLEIRIDAERQTIHLRSASRVGHGDAGVNRERVERLRQLFLQ